MLRFIFFVSVLLTSVYGFCQNLNDCDLFYSQRGSQLTKAQDCYQELDKAKTISKEVFFDRSFTNLSTMVSLFEKQREERQAIDKAFILLDDVKKQFGQNAYYNYWTAVWTSFDAIQKDRGALIPTNLFSQISTIQNLLKSAINLDPTIHYYGPHRVLGIMHTQMPKIAGGDKKYSEQLLKTAYDQQPFYHGNPFAYANILYINGRNDEAKAVLQNFLINPNEKYETYLNEPLRSLALEIQKEKIKAQDLLKTIAEEEQ
jgi:hypothetical protein